MAWWQRRSQRDFNAEIESHLELEAERLAAGGMAPDAARAAARRAFGNVGQAEEAFFDRSHLGWLEDLIRDLRQSARNLAARPAFALTAVLTLALGIGLNTGVFSLIYAVAMRPLPVREPERVVMVFQDVRQGGGRMTMGPWTEVSYPEYQRYRDRSQSFEGIAVYRGMDLVLTANPPQPIQGSLVSCNYFSTLSVRFGLGRGFGSEGCARPSDAPVTVLSDQLWRTRFGADPAIVGRTLTVNGVAVLVVGVAEAGFKGIDWVPADLWLPVTMQPAVGHEGPALLVREKASWLTMVGRLKRGTSREVAQAELSVVGQTAAAGDSGKLVRVSVTRGALFTEPGMRRQADTAAAGILGLSALVILLACTNLVNLLLARALAKRREIGIRLSLGASRLRVVRQLMIESILLALAGGGLGLVIVYRLPGVLAAAVPNGEFIQTDFSPDLPVFGYAIAISAVAAVLFGLLPALQATRLDISSSIKLADPLLGRTGTHRLRTFVVGAQVAGSALLVAMAGLFLHALDRANGVDLGYRTAGVIAIRLGTEQLGYDATRSREVYDRLGERLRAVPGVESVALASGLPLLGRNTSDVQSADENRPAWAAFNQVSPEYFATLGIRIVEGRVFRAEESGLAGDQPAVISETAARTLWPGADPLGRRIRMGNVDNKSATYFVVTGVAADAHNVSIGQPDQPFIYRAANPANPSGSLMVVATEPRSVAGLLGAVAAVVREIDPAVPVQVSRLEDRQAEALAPARMAARFATALGGLATLLAIVGIYGIVSYGVTQRAREFGVRIALGATNRQIVRLALGQGLVVVTVGLLVGFGLSLAAARVVRGLLYGLGGLDPVALVATLFVVAATASAAMLVPARRATTINPIDSLRSD